VSGARDDVLARVRAALGPDRPAPAPVARDYATGLGVHGPADSVMLDLLVDRLEDYKATVVRAAGTEVASAVAGSVSRHQVRRLVVPDGVPQEWLAALDAAALVRDDPPLSVEDLDAAGGVLTGCRVAVAETGTIVLDGGPGQGRRALTLVPDWHLCVVRADQVVPGVPDGLARLDPLRPMTFVSGPSATSDIELERVEGVHGPRTLVVVLVES
jgi:L-lactate dehydrogenase complex protein LldG